MDLAGREPQSVGRTGAGLVGAGGGGRKSVRILKRRGRRPLHSRVIPRKFLF